MTAAEWRTGEDIYRLIDFLTDDRRPLPVRKWRLYAAGCCRRLGELFPDPRLLKAVDAVERFADGRIGGPALARWRREAVRARDALPGTPTAARLACDAVVRAAAAEGYSDFLFCWRPPFEHPGAFPRGEAPELRSAFRGLLRDIFGDPFRPAAADPRWLTTTVTAVAGSIYAERAFDRLPILADALEEAGCDDAGVLAHLRGDGPHVRGCWAVDLVLGRE